MKHKIEVRLDEEQYAKIAEKAENFGMKPEEFAVFTMLNSQIKVVIGQDPLLAKVERAVDLLENGSITEQEFEIIKKRLFEEIKNEQS
ncbi:hypothetical protein J6Z19_00580 [bacterium]|nr:hypothetical protein [bacterium]